MPAAAKKLFKALQKALISKPCLAAVNFDKEFVLTCDASATHYIACLSQVNNKGIEQPCAYASKLLSTKESKQAPGLSHFNPYLGGKEFVLCTDHKPNLSIIKGKTNVYDTLTDEIMNSNGIPEWEKMFVDILSRPPGFQTFYIWSQPDYEQMLTHTSGLRQKTPLNPLLKEILGTTSPVVRHRLQIAKAVIFRSESSW